jgi:alkylation response protein AidB-like acyl-CoA dehydrogenase
LYPKHVQEEYWASLKPLAASSFIPTGTGAPADGGFTLNGRWGFCSGIDYCDWIIVGAVIPAGANSAPVMRYCLIPTSQCRIVDDWNVSAMRATGSKAIFLDGVFVPADHVLSDAEISEGRAPGVGLHASPTFSAPAWTLQGFSIGAAVTGIARAGFDELREDFRGRYARRDPGIMGKLGAVQMHFTEVSAMLDCSDMFYETALSETFKQVNETRSVTLERRIQNRRDLAYSVLNAKRAVDILLPMAGARYLAEDRLLQRCWRDVGAASTHPALNWDGPALSCGNVLLGGEPTEFRY